MIEVPDDPGGGHSSSTPDPRRDLTEDAVEELALVRHPVYTVKLQAFEGPLDLLLHLIRQHEIDIYDIPIADITKQYLDYIGFMESLDLVLAGDFLEMAATLIRIKVQMLLPATLEESDEEDPRQQLVRKLVEYKKFKEAALRLSDFEHDRRKLFARGIDPVIYRDLEESEDHTEEILKDVTIFHLVDALREVLSRVPPRISVHAVDMETVSVEDRMEWIRSVVRERGSASFAELFSGSVTRAEIVTTFVALLELIRLRALTAVQTRLFGEIRLEPRAEA